MSNQPSFVKLTEVVLDHMINKASLSSVYIDPGNVATIRPDANPGNAMRLLEGVRLNEGKTLTFSIISTKTGEKIRVVGDEEEIRQKLCMNKKELLNG